jgi:hypothetical protein
VASRSAMETEVGPALRNEERAIGIATLGTVHAEAGITINAAGRSPAVIETRVNAPAPAAPRP